MSFFKNIFGGGGNEASINWKTLTSEQDLEQLIERSKTVPCVIFKHSTRCSISSMAKNRLESSWDMEEEKVEIYYLDLIQYRSVSNKIAEVFGVQHASPQALFIKDGKSLYDSSHSAISTADIRELV